jgi:peroxiredoxin Q/BCP
MAQLRLDHDQFLQRGAQIIVIGAEGAAAFADYWEANRLPFLGLPDPKHSVLKLYGQQVKLFR